MPVVSLPSIPAGSDVYIDANIFIYGMLQKSPECLRFLTRCGSDIQGYSDVKVLHDTMHKLMCAEAGKSAAQLKKDPAQIRSLKTWQNLAGIVRRLPIEWISFDMNDAELVPPQATGQGLLCGDALISVFMDAYGIRAIASSDGDFANLGLLVYAPTDI